MLLNRIKNESEFTSISQTFVAYRVRKRVAVVVEEVILVTAKLLFAEFVKVSLKFGQAVAC